MHEFLWAFYSNRFLIKCLIPVGVLLHTRKFEARDFFELNEDLKVRK
jgi:hypothetical protein